MLRTALLHCAEHNLVSTDPLQYVVIAECAGNKYPEYVRTLILQVAVRTHHKYWAALVLAHPSARIIIR